jgi:hypothetical protein
MAGPLLLLLLLCSGAGLAAARIENLVIDDDERTVFNVATFGFFKGGVVQLDLRSLAFIVPENVPTGGPNDTLQAGFFLAQVRRLQLAPRAPSVAGCWSWGSRRSWSQGGRWRHGGRAAGALQGYENAPPNCPAAGRVGVGASPDRGVYTSPLRATPSCVAS